MQLLARGQSQVPTDCRIYTDASGSWGCGGVFREKWFQSEISIRTKELLPIVISCAVWGPALYQKSIEDQCDTTGAVSTINKGSSKDKTAMHLFRCLWFFAALFQIRITTTHIPGIDSRHDLCIVLIWTVRSLVETLNMVSNWLNLLHF